MVNYEHSMQEGCWLTRKNSKAFDLSNECRKFTIGRNAERIKDRKEKDFN